MFTLTTDTSCDIKRNELNERGIPWVPLIYIMDGEQHYDEFTTDEQYKNFYDKVRAGAMPTTSQISEVEHEEFFEKVIASGANDIVHLTLSGGLSATYSMACKAAEEVEKRHEGVKINVVDTRGATQVHAFVLDKADELRREGLSGAEAKAILDEFTKRVHVVIIVDDLNHLRRGGRVSGVAAAIGSLLNIKPILTFDKAGKLRVVHKAKGIRKAIEYVRDYIKKWNPEVKKVYMAQGDAMESANLANDEFKAAFGCEVKIGWCGPVIGAHTGAGLLGMIFESEKERPLEGE